MKVFDNYEFTEIMTVENTCFAETTTRLNDKDNVDDESGLITQL